MKVGVLGAGSWGTALSLILARNGHEVGLYGREPEEIASIRAQRENMRYLPGFAIPEEVEVGLTDEAPESMELWVIAVPSAGFREALSHLRNPEAHLCIASKGLEPVSAKLLSAVVEEVLPRATVSAISGPNLAVELARGIPTAAVVACADETEAEHVACAFNCRTLRVYITDDLIGLELAGALKNVLAIAAGMSDGLGFGDNTKGALLARGLKDMTLLGVALGAQPETFYGIAGVGDLFATANSHLSRNYRVGEALGKGRTLTEALKEIGQVAEGVTTSESAVQLARKHGTNIPIFEAVDSVIQGRLRPMEAVGRLMERQPKREGFPVEH